MKCDIHAKSENKWKTWNISDNEFVRKKTPNKINFELVGSR